MDRFICIDAGVSKEVTIGAMVDPHSHDYYEIYYFFGDEMTFFLDSTSFTLHTHDIVLVNNHVYHKTFYDQNKDCSRANISFNLGFLHRFFDSGIISNIVTLFLSPMLIHSQKQNNEQLGVMIKSICTDSRSGDELSALRRYHGLCLLLVEFLRIAGHFQKGSLIDGALSERSIVFEVAEYINKNYRLEITLSSLAKEFSISRFYLSRFFKNTTGIGITDFINRKRIAEAMFFLENTDTTIINIAAEVGFNSQAYFIKTFRTFQNTTPSKYRKEKQHLNEYCERFQRLEQKFAAPHLFP